MILISHTIICVVRSAHSLSFLEMKPPRSAWILTDGKVGDEQPCLGVAEAMGVMVERRIVRPGKPFTWMMPFGMIDPRERASRENSPLAPPFPDLVIASGRRAVPYLREIRRLSLGRSFTVFLKDPRTGINTADFLWVPQHDTLRGPNVLVTLTAPHRITATRLEEARRLPDPRLASLPVPKIAVLVGGDSRHHHFTGKDISRLLTVLEGASQQGSLMITPSRRTASVLVEALHVLAQKTGGFCWTGEEPNPYIAMLALADVVLVTADSANMVGEACAAGVPVHVFEPGGGHPKLTRTLDALRRKGLVQPQDAPLTFIRQTPLDSTPHIAAEILKAYEVRQKRFFSSV
jgi:uncharacterized protein